MVVLSVLRPSLQGGRSLLLRTCSKAQWLTTPTKITTAVVARNMADHKKHIEMIPSRFDWERWKNDVHFYVFIGLVPMGLLIFYANVFIGQGELADISEDYEPRHWEYYKSPIVRFLARYVYDSPEKQYERTMHVLYEQNETRKLKILDRKVKDLMYERLDYKGWYYIPVDKDRVDQARAAVEYDEKVTGTS